MISILYPHDWAHTPSNFDFIVETSNIEQDFIVKLFEFDQFQENKTDQSVITLSKADFRIYSDMFVYEFKNLRPTKYTIVIEIEGTVVQHTSFIVNKIFDKLLENISSDKKFKNSKKLSKTPFFTITTTVFNTDVIFLNELYKSIVTQKFNNFEWIILDNGSLPIIKNTIKKFTKLDSRIKFYRVSKNLHIIGGNRYLLERAHGKYIVPVDSDDLLYKNTLLEIYNSLINNPTEICYTDEFKLSPTGKVAELIWRSEFSRYAAYSTCPAAHIVCFERSFGLLAGVYSGDYAKGAHDWDTFLRIIDAGGSASQIRQCLYGWRMHKKSTAFNIKSKNYIRQSQHAVVKNSLTRRGLATRFNIEDAFPETLGYLKLVRKKVFPKNIEIDIWLGTETYIEIENVCANIASFDYPNICKVRFISNDFQPRGEVVKKLLNIAKSIGISDDRINFHVLCGDPIEKVLSEFNSNSEMKIVMGPSGKIVSRNWIWDMVGTMELDDDTSIVGGVVLKNDYETVQHLGWVVSFNGVASSPYINVPFDRTGVGTPLLLNRSVSGVWGGVVGVRRSFSDAHGSLLGIDTSDGMYGLEYGLRSLQNKKHASINLNLIIISDQVDGAYSSKNRKLVELLHDQFNIHNIADPYYSIFCSNKLGQYMYMEYLIEYDLDNKNSDNDQKKVDIEYDKNYQISTNTSQHILSYLYMSKPLNFHISEHLSQTPVLNIIIPTLSLRGMSGGPNTAINIGYRLALLGIPIRFISSCASPDADRSPLTAHMMNLAGTNQQLPNVELIDGTDRNKEVFIGRRDMFMATAWWTAHMVIAQLPEMLIRQYFYLIQDFEPVLHPASSLQALALATYDSDMIPVVNHPLLNEYFVENKIGAFASEKFCNDAIVFTPAIDRKSFWVEKNAFTLKSERTLLFYARPQTALRNLFEVGVLALHVAANRGLFADGDWRIYGIGEKFESFKLTENLTLEYLPWLDFQEYAKLIRNSDILLSLMMAPHPSYPPLEIAACGGLVVTNSFGTKTKRTLEAYSKNIIVANPNIESVVSGLFEAVSRLEFESSASNQILNHHPSNWSESLADTLPKMVSHWIRLTSR